jgi:Dirigent-like protein
MMKLTKRSSIVVVLGGIAVTAAVAVPNGSAQAPAPAGGTTFSFYEPDAQSTFKIVDNPPKTFGTSPGPKSRFSVGDRLTFSSALFDKKGGTREGRLYADGTIVKGGTFDTATLVATGTYVLNDGSQISVQGYFSVSKDSTVSIVGGTGSYEGARGHMFSKNSANASTDTLTLLP